MTNASEHVSYRAEISPIPESIHMLSANISILNTIVSQLLIQQLNGDPKSVDELAEDAGKLPAGTAKDQILGMIEIAKLVDAELKSAGNKYQAMLDDPNQRTKPDIIGPALLRFTLLDALMKAIRRFIQEKIRSTQQD